MSQTTTPLENESLSLESGVEALRSSPEFTGAVEAMDGPYCNDHFALLYENQAERLEAIVPFLRQGLERGERCMYVIDRLSEETLRGALRDGGVDVDAALDSGQLSIHTVGETYLRNGTFDPDEMIDFYAETVEEAAAEYTAFRVVAETTWLQREDVSMEAFMEYESKINALFDGNDCIALCQYDRNGFEPDVVETIIQTHPHLIFDGTVCNNVYYTPPEEYFAPDEPAREVDRMMRTLLDRTEARVTLENRQRAQRTFHEITSDSDRTFEEKLQAVFELGVEVFDMELGAIARVDPETDRFEIERTSGAHDHIEPGISMELSETYCRLVTDGGTAAVSDPEAGGFGTSPVYREFGIQAYLGTHLSLGSGDDRTFFFVSSERRDEPVTEDERTFHHLMGQWVSHELQQRRRESQLAALNEMSRALMDEPTFDQIATVTVDHAHESLELPLSAVVTYDREAGSLAPVAQTQLAKEKLSLDAFCTETDSPIWDAFISTEPAVVDATADQYHRNGVTEIAAFPLGQQGVFITATTRPTGFESIEWDFVETTAATIEAASTRADRERQLHAREETLEEQNTTLERLDRINTTIRNIDQALVQSSTRSEIEGAVCEQLASAGPYEFAWIGSQDTVTDEIVPQEAAGVEKGYLDEVTGQGSEHGPARRSLAAREPQVVNNVLKDESFEPWRQAALNRGYHACIALPLVYEGSLYGVLAIYAAQPDVFNDLEQSVLAEMADTIAYAINAVESKRALVSDERTELEFAIEDMGLGIVDLVRSTGCEFSLETLVAKSDGTLRGFFTTKGVEAETVLAFTPRLPVTDLTAVSERTEDDERLCLFEATLDRGCLAESVLEHGGQLRRLDVTEDGATVTVQLAADAETRSFVEMFSSKYTGVELLAQRSRRRERTDTRGLRAVELAELTARQLEVLQTAYFNGYFEEPRTRTASEIAETLDISQPTFNSHARAAERKLFDQLFEQDTLGA